MRGGAVFRARFMICAEGWRAHGGKLPRPGKMSA